MKKLGKYIIQGELGQGGMGMVYRARDPDIGRDVAIKMIHERALNVPEVRERFYREARSAGRLSHENITVIHDIGEQDGEPFIVMELLSGTDLRTTLLTQTAMPLDQKLDIALQVCRGLLYAHQHHIIHRDIKPENIRVLTSGRIKIMDFGIARIGGDSQTLTHSSIGSPRYMSPEQVRGKKVDHRTDIFSFGVLLYELITGVNPFSGDHVTTVIYKIIHEEPEPINLDNPHLTEDLQQIISRCLEKDVNKRYQSLTAVIEDLSDLLTRWRMEQPVGDTLSAERTLTHALRPSTRSSPKPSQKRSAPWMRIAAGVVLLGGLAAGGYVLWPVLQPSPPPMSETAAVPSETGTAAPLVEPPAATLEPTAPATDSAVSTDPPSAEPPASEETTPPAAEDDLQQLRAEADRRRARMQAQRQQATAADAPTLASALYAQAQRLEQAGHDALAQETPDGYASAERAFADAAQRYAAAAETAGQRQEADQAQHAMEQARQQILDAREDDAIASAFEQADALRATALQRYESGQFALSTATFNAARERYAELRQQLDAAAGAASAASEAQLEAATQARTAMRAAKDAIPPDQRQHPQYQQALQLEDQGQQAFAAEAFEAAAAHFTQAESTFQEVAEIARAEAQARQAIHDLVARFERTFEQEDLDALQAFHSFYAAWSSFFDVADNVNATASSENLDVRGDAASVQVHLQFDYRDNKNRSQSNSFIHTWNLQRTSDGTWIVAEVTPQ